MTSRDGSVTSDISMKAIIPAEIVERKIFLIRGHKVMLDTHLAELYGVGVGRLNESVRRNTDRFPADFMFQLTSEEHENLISQFAISSLNSAWGGRRHSPYAFTEQGVAMLSGILRSKQAVQVNVAIMRAFVKLREMLSSHKELGQKLAQLEHRIAKHDGDIQAIFDAIRQLMAPPSGPTRSVRRIGFHADARVKWTTR